MFTCFCSKFIQENLSESPEFCRRYYKIHFGLIFSRTLYVIAVNRFIIICWIMFEGPVETLFYGQKYLNL